jgi:hypothetical protein
VFAAAGWAIGAIDQHIVVASGADYAVNGFAELIVTRLRSVSLPNFFPADCHG